MQGLGTAAVEDVAGIVVRSAPVRLYRPTARGRCRRELVSPRVHIDL